MSDKATPEHPVYRRVLDLNSGATPIYLIVCDEGWRESIVCSGMYDWAADWLLSLLDGRPYAPGFTP